MIYPFLLALFPILGFFAQNSTQVSCHDLLMPICVALAGTFVIWLLAMALLGCAEVRVVHLGGAGVRLVHRTVARGRQLWALATELVLGCDRV